MVLSQEVEDICQRLRRRQLEGALPCAKATAEVLRTLVTSRRHPDAQALLDDVKSTGIKIQDAKPLGANPCPLPLHPCFLTCLLHPPVILLPVLCAIFRPRVPIAGGALCKCITTFFRRPMYITESLAGNARITGFARSLGAQSYPRAP